MKHTHHNILPPETTIKTINILYNADRGRGKMKHSRPGKETKPTPKCPVIDTKRWDTISLTFWKSRKAKTHVGRKNSEHNTLRAREQSANKTLGARQQSGHTKHSGQV
jgi:hypothetical protein